MGGDTGFCNGLNFYLDVDFFNATLGLVSKAALSHLIESKENRRAGDV
jgi:hypothetical protein